MSKINEDRELEELERWFNEWTWSQPNLGAWRNFKAKQEDLSKEVNMVVTTSIIEIWLIVDWVVKRELESIDNQDILDQRVSWALITWHARIWDILDDNK